LSSQKISIITVSLNAAENIQQAIESVAFQADVGLEHIICDGFSSDETQEIVERQLALYNHINYISEKDGGIYDTINKGIQMATGSIIGILNADDFYANDTVLKMVLNEFEIDPSIDIVYGDLNYVHKLSPSKIFRKWVSKNYYDNFFEDGNDLPHPTMFVRKEVFDKIGNYNTSLKIASDYEWMLRALKVYQIKSKHLPFLMVNMRLGGVSNKNLLNVIRQNLEVMNAWRLNGLKPSLLMILKKMLIKLKQIRLFT
jgi:glycosyltransferase involved in cell wall biosynthesis